MKQSIFAVTCVLLMLLAACGESKFKIEGNVEGGEGKTLVLEKADYSGTWITIDSVKIGGSGKFSMSSQPPASPDIYRLTLGDKYIYFPIDSVENLKLETTAADFGHKFTLTGSPQAEMMARFEMEVMNLDASNPSAVADFKRNAYTKYIKEGQGSIVSYYILTKFIDGKPLFDPEDAQDAKYYAAVATQYENYRPDDPHAQMIKEISLNAMRKKNKAAGKQTVMEADLLKVIEIELPDINGKNVKLSEVVGKGKPVVVVFSMMNSNESPAFHMELRKLYEARKGNIEIYEVSFDNDRFAWRASAENLPWINVIDPQLTSSKTLRDYNVSAFPSIFLYNAEGDLIDRPESLKALESKL